MLFTKNLKNVKLKQKMFYKFTNSFKMIDIVNAQIYRLKLLKQLENLFYFLYIFVKVLS